MISQKLERSWQIIALPLLLLSLQVQIIPKARKKPMKKRHMTISGSQPTAVQVEAVVTHSVIFPAFCLCAKCPGTKLSKGWTWNDSRKRWRDMTLTLGPGHGTTWTWRGFSRCVSLSHVLRLCACVWCLCWVFVFGVCVWCLCFGLWFLCLLGRIGASNVNLHQCLLVVFYDDQKQGFFRAMTFCYSYNQMDEKNDYLHT